MQPTSFFRLELKILFSILVLSAFFLSAKCPPTTTTVTEDPPWPCNPHVHFVTLEMHTNRMSILKDQLKAFNNRYSVYNASPTPTQPAPTDPIPNPYFQKPHWIRNSFSHEPESSIKSIVGEGRDWGLMFGFGRPAINKDAITIYAVLTREINTRINADTCKVEYEFIEDTAGEKVFYGYNLQSETWTRIDSSVIDQWVSNLYETDPSKAPAFKGYYVQHGMGDNLDSYLYLGLKKGNQKDTLNIFHMTKPLKESLSHDSDGRVIKEIVVQDEFFGGTVGQIDLSKKYWSKEGISPTKHTIVRACPPHCAATPTF